MKIRHPLLFVATTCLFTTLATARADLLITQKVDGLGANAMEMTTRVKGDKMRVDPTPEMSMIVDAKTGDMVNVMHAQKAYLRISGDTAKAMMEQMKLGQNAGGAPAAKPQLASTGKKETIDGYACEEYAGTTSNGLKLSFMLTKALPNYEAALKQLADAASHGPLAQQTQGMGLDFGSLPGFPLRTTVEVGPGQKMTSTVTAVSTAPLPDGDFVTPAGYKEMAMPSLTPPAPSR